MTDEEREEFKAFEEHSLGLLEKVKTGVMTMKEVLAERQTAPTAYGKLYGQIRDEKFMNAVSGEQK